MLTEDNLKSVVEGGYFAYVRSPSMKLYKELLPLVIRRPFPPVNI